MIISLNSNLIFLETYIVYNLINLNYILLNIINILLSNKYFIALNFNQIGISYKYFLIKISSLIFFLFYNYLIIWKSKQYLYSGEGCISILNTFLFKKRYKYIVLLINLNNRLLKFFIMNFYACCIQHEYDHSFGLTIVK